MKSFTDIFIKRPVLALVVSFVILIAGLAGDEDDQRSSYPRSDIAADYRDDRLYRSGRGVGARIYYYSARARHRRRRRDRLHPVAEPAECFDHHRASETQLRREQGFVGHQFQGRPIRRDLPPEAEIPVIAIQAADSQFASAYLSFTSDILQPNEVTDYLVRLIQPPLDRGRWSAKGRHPGRSDFRHAHLDETRADGCP